jgi:hypothetical protein
VENTAEDKKAQERITRQKIEAALNGKWFTIVARTFEKRGVGDYYTVQLFCNGEVIDKTNPSRGQASSMVWQHVYEMLKNSQQFNLPVMLKWDLQSYMQDNYTQFLYIPTEVKREKDL